MTERELVRKLVAQDRSTQKYLYDTYAPRFFGTCLRYLKNREDAEDVLVEAFFKILTRVSQYKFRGNLEGWMRRIVINECLMFLRKRQLDFQELEPELAREANLASPLEDLYAEDLLKLIERLPTGYRTVFNLYVIEGYKHREIADILDISINTSKSQLILARRKLQEWIQNMK